MNGIYIKKLLGCLVLTWYLQCGHAQSFFRQLEFGAGPSVAMAAKGYGATVEAAWGIEAEIRYHFSGSPFDAGFHFGLGTFYRNWPRTVNIEKSYHFKDFIFIGDYNFRRARNISPFLSAGLGFSALKVDTFYPRYSVWERRYTPCLMSRAGIEFWHAVRLSADYKLMKKYYGRFGFTLSVVPGGWKRPD